LKNWIVPGIVSICIAFIAVIATLRMRVAHMEEMEEIRSQWQTVEVLVATKHIFAGDKLSMSGDSANVTMVQFPERLLHKLKKGTTVQYNAITAEHWDNIRKTDFRPHINLGKMELLRWSHLTLASMLESGRVAAKTLEVSARCISPMTESIASNDRVDILATLDLPREDRTATSKSPSAVLLRNIRVQAVSMIGPEEKVVRLIVPPLQKGYLRYAQRHGTLLLVKSDPQDQSVEELNKKILSYIEGHRNKMK
jgi:Flp pilus assembly protein CpaB